MSEVRNGALREIEVTAPTVEEASREALERLGAVPAEVVVEPVSPAAEGTESAGAIRVRLREGRNERISEIGSAVILIAQILAGLLDRMGLPLPVTVRQESAGDALLAEIGGKAPGLLIGRHGQTLSAIEYFLNRALANRLASCPYVYVDAGGYRERRRATLQRIAEKARSLVRRRRRPLTLEPMSPRDRREIHLALAGDEWVTTESIGDGEHRRVRVVPRSAGQRR